MSGMMWSDTAVTDLQFKVKLINGNSIVIFSETWFYRRNQCGHKLYTSTRKCAVWVLPNDSFSVLNPSTLRGAQAYTDGYNPASAESDSKPNDRKLN